MSPGSTSSSASSRVSVVDTRSTVPVSRASISSVSRFSIDVELDEPTRPLLEERPQVRRDPAPVGEPGLELDRVVEGLDVLPVDRVLLVALDRVGDEVLGEGDHPGPGVVGPPFVEADLLSLDLLQERGQQQPDRSRADDVDPPTGRCGLT